MGIDLMMEHRTSVKSILENEEHMEKQRDNKQKTGAIAIFQ